MHFAAKIKGILDAYFFIWFQYLDISVLKV